MTSHTSPNGETPDGATVSLVLQGGAMRVAYTLGVLSAVQQSGLRSSVSSVVASSAGMIAGFGLCTSDVDAYADELFRQLAGRRFINWRRPLRVVDVDYLVSVVDSLVGLGECDTFADVDLVASIVDARQGVVHYRKLDETNAATMLRATMAIPVLYSRQVPYEGSFYVDGGVADSVPVVETLIRRPGSVLGVVLTKSPYAISDHATKAFERAAIMLDPRLSRTIRRMMLCTSAIDQQTQRVLQMGIGSARIVWTAPEGPLADLSRTCTDVGALNSLMDLGRHDGGGFCELLREQLTAKGVQ